MNSINEEQLSLLDKSHSRSESRLSSDQLIFSFLLMLPGIAPGMANAFSAIALPQLRLNINESSWFTSMIPLASIIGNISAGLIIDRYGRKITFLLNTIPTTVGFFLLSKSPILINLYMGQFLCGISLGAVTIPTATYIAESIVSNNLKVRSSLVTWNILAINIGIFLVYLFGRFFHYYQVATIGAIISFVSTIVILIFIPESPAWLQNKGKHKDAALARKRLSFKSVQEYTSLNNANHQVDDIRKENIITYVKYIKRKDVHKPLLISVTFFFFQQFSGVQVFTAHMVNIMSVSTLSVNPFTLTIISGILQIISQVLFILIVPYTGVKKICMISSAGTGFSIFLLGITLYMNDKTESYRYLNDWIHIFAVWFTAFMCVGICTLPYTIVSEILPIEAKGFAALPVVGVAIFYFSVLMIYPYALLYYNYGVYFGFSIMNFCTITFIYFFVPETVGKTLEEISKGFL